MRLSKRAKYIFHVHSYTGYANILALATVASRKPVLWTLHCYWGGEGGPEGSNSCYQAAWALAPQFLRRPNTAEELRILHEELRPLFNAHLWITTPSASVAKAALRCPELANWKIRHIPNGVNTKAFCPLRKSDQYLRNSLGLNADKIVILIVNRNFKIVDKGFHMALEALSALPPGTNVQVFLVGQNADWAACMLPDCCHATSRNFVSDREQMIRFYEAADIFLFASHRENFPCVTLEAMAAGCCVVATPTDGVTEQITHEQDGLLADGINGSALSVPLRRAIQDASLRRALGAQARIKVETEFSEAFMVSQYLKLYMEIKESSLLVR